MKKRTLAMLLALLALSLPGCGSSPNPDDAAQPCAQSADDAVTLPETSEQKPVADAPMMVMVDNTLYQSNGEVSTVDGRCGNMDGELTQQVDASQFPTEDGQCNFGSGLGYQRFEDHIEILLHHRWMILAPYEG